MRYTAPHHLLFFFFPLFQSPTHWPHRLFSLLRRDVVRAHVPAFVTCAEPTVLYEVEETLRIFFFFVSLKSPQEL